ncbi:cytosine-purine permease [Marasmius fiardii PR-910]|nr:cytosine-purine permease [Marasmius fiardii PR-910]
MDVSTKRSDEGVQVEKDSDLHDHNGADVELGQIQPTRDLDSDFKKWSTKLGVSCSIELNGITPTTVEERTEPRMYQLSTVWVSAILNITSLATGALGPQVFGLGFTSCSGILVVADVISCLIPGYIAVFGPKLGTRTMVQSRYSFGYYGAILPAAFNVFSMIGFLILGSITGGQLLAAVFSNLNETLGIVIISLISLVISFCGYQVLHWFETYAWIPNAVIYITLLAVAGKKLSLRPEIAPPTVAAIISYGTTAGASCSSWGSMSADYGVYHRADVPGWKIFLYTYFGVLLSSFPGHIIGAALAAAAPAVPAWQAGLEDGQNFGNFLAVVLDPVGGFGKFLVVIATLTLPAQSATSMYSFGVSFMSVSFIFTKIPRYVYSVIATAVVIPVSIVGAHTFFQTCFDYFLFLASHKNPIYIDLIGYWSISYAAVVLVEHFVFRRYTFAKYKTEFWQTPSKLPLGIAGVVAFGLSFGLIVPSMDQPWHVGQFAQRGTGDIGLITGFFSAGLFYLILRPIEKLLFPGHDA